MENHILPPFGELAERHLIDALDWIAREMFDGQGARPLLRLVVADLPSATHRGGRGPGDSGRCDVAVQWGANEDQVRHQVFHEAFHVLIGRNIYHWTQEVAAELAAQRLHEASHASGYAAVHRGEAHSITGDDLRAFLWAGNPPGHGPDREFYYHRARAVGLHLEPVVGLLEVGRLARRVAAVAGGCNVLGHVPHAGCVMSAAVDDWLYGLGQQQAANVRQVLGLAG